MIGEKSPKALAVPPGTRMITLALHPSGNPGKVWACLLRSLPRAQSLFPPVPASQNTPLEILTPFEGLLVPSR